MKLKLSFIKWEQLIVTIIILGVTIHPFDSNLGHFLFRIYLTVDHQMLVTPIREFPRSLNCRHDVSRIYEANMNLFGSVGE
jgi:hypothetical protein